jgi:hypothetical protein
MSTPTTTRLRWHAWSPPGRRSRERCPGSSSTKRPHAPGAARATNALACAPHRLAVLTSVPCRELRTVASPDLPNSVQLIYTTRPRPSSAATRSAASFVPSSGSRSSGSRAWTEGDRGRANDRRLVRFGRRGRAAAPASPARTRTRAALRPVGQHVRLDLRTVDGGSAEPGQRADPRRAPGRAVRPCRQRTLVVDTDPTLGDCSQAPTVQMTSRTIGDALTEQGVTWGWFEGGFANCARGHRNIGGQRGRRLHPPPRAVPVLRLDRKPPSCTSRSRCCRRSSP